MIKSEQNYNFQSLEEIRKNGENDNLNSEEELILIFGFRLGWIAGWNTKNINVGTKEFIHC